MFKAGQDDVRGRLLASLVVASSVGTSLLALEIVTRLIDGVPVLASDNFVARAMDHVHHTFSLYDPKLGWLIAPNWRVGDGEDTITTGELSARMSSSEVAPLQQGAILAVGDSFTLGSETGDRGSWPAQLERMLGEQVINAASGGWGVDQIVLRAEDLVPRLHPKLLLVGMFSQDSFRNNMSVFGGGAKPYFLIENGELALHNVPVPRMASAPRDIGWLRSVLGHSYLVHFAMIRLNLLSWWVADSLQHNRIASDQEGVRVSCLLMKRLAALRDQYQMRVGLIIEYGGYETREDNEPWYGPPVDGCARNAGLDVVNDFVALHSVFQKDGIEAFQRLFVMHEKNRAYGHMSAAGNHLVASLIAASMFGNSSVQAK